MRRAIIVGASTGIGRALCHELAHDGYQVFALARSENKLQELVGELKEAYGPLAAAYRVHDVQDIDSIQPLFDEILNELGNLDILCYVSGVMPEVGEHEFNTEKDLLQVQVNLSGALAWLNCGANFFQQKRAGCLAAVGSVAGDRGRAAKPAYHATKAGLATFMESLWMRLSPLGVRVVTIKPGPIATPMTANLTLPTEPYPVKPAAREMVTAMEKGSRVAYVPGKWRWIMLIIIHIPAVIMRKLNL